MVFIDTSNSQAAIKAAQSGCPGRAGGTGDQQKQARVGGSAPATGGGCCRLPALATSAAQWPVLPIKPSQRLGAACLAALLYRPVSSVHLPPIPAGIFSQFFCLVPLPPVLRWLLTGWEQHLQNRRGAEEAFAALTSDSLRESHAKINVAKQCCWARGAAEVR